MPLPPRCSATLHKCTTAHEAPRYLQVDVRAKKGLAASSDSTVRLPSSIVDASPLHARGWHGGEGADAAGLAGLALRESRRRRLRAATAGSMGSAGGPGLLQRQLRPRAAAAAAVLGESSNHDEFQLHAWCVIRVEVWRQLQRRLPQAISAMTAAACCVNGRVKASISG